MLNRIPERIKFIFKNTDGPIRGLIVFFVLRSTVKNDFTIGPLLTDVRGEVILTKEIFDRVIHLEKEDFPMDYDGDLGDCDLLRIIVESRSELENRLRRLVRYYPDSAKILQDLLGHAVNGEAGFCKSITFPTDKEIISINLD